MHANKDLLIIVADPKDDSVFVSYNDKHAGGKIASLKGDKPRLVKNILKSSGFDRHIDDFLISLAEAIGVKKLVDANNFLQFLDGALFNLAKRSRTKSHKEVSRSVGKD